jgi:rhodanese-related sulfurtransferase
MIRVSRLTRGLAGSSHCSSPVVLLRRSFSDAAAPAGFISSSQLKSLLQGPASERPSVVDLREAEELAHAALTSCGVVHLPLSKAAGWVPLLSSIIDTKRSAVVLCQHGRSRSVAGAEKLRSAGVADVKVRARASAWCIELKSQRRYWKAASRRIRPSMTASPSTPSTLPRSSSEAMCESVASFAIIMEKAGLAPCSHTRSE